MTKSGGGVAVAGGRQTEVMLSSSQHTQPGPSGRVSSHRPGGKCVISGGTLEIKPEDGCGSLPSANGAANGKRQKLTWFGLEGP